MSGHFDEYELPPPDLGGAELEAFEDTVLEGICESFLAPSSPVGHRTYDLWPDGGAPIIGSIGLRKQRPSTECVFCYRTTDQPGRPRAMVHPIYDPEHPDEEPASLGSYAYNAMTQGELEPIDQAELGDLRTIRWSADSSASHQTAEESTFDPSIVNVFISFDLRHGRDGADELIDMSRRDDSPFRITGTTDQPGRPRPDPLTMQKAEIVIVVCNRDEPISPLVELDLRLAHQLGKPHLLVAPGEPGGRGHRPLMSRVADQVYPLSWRNILVLLSRRQSFGDK
jgi:hypothetical protein